MSDAVPTLRFSHFGFHVRDIAAMEDFYVRVLGLVVTDRGDLGPVRLVFLSRDPEEHHQIVLASGRPAEAAFNPINQISFRVPDLASLRALDRRLRTEAVAERIAVTHGNAISVYFRDPEGNRIEAFFDTPWYCRQPLREAVDLEQPDDALMARAEAIARATPDFQPRARWVEAMRARMGAA
ncbi:MAG TPA: VOC family protein [Burkholderiaceae bacterium]|nr:VOC family protein [Burkholderiaceae bacterium]